MPVTHLTNGTIENISSERGITFVLVTYMGRLGRRREEQTVQLVVNPRTIILNTRGEPISASALRTGMNINASFSSEMTRSIPPQANAYLIRIMGRPMPDDITIGRILDINRNNRSFTTMTDRDFSTVIRFNTSDNTTFFDRFGRPIQFSRLNPGMRVRVRHANFMTASLPPQTTAFEVRML